MNRRSIVVVLLLPFALGSCMKYQYMTVKSDLKTTPRGYVVGNDSLTITYHFAGADCPVEVEIENKSRRPMYVDWSRSALVINKKTYAWNSQSKLSASSTGFSVYSVDGIGYSSADISGVITTPMSTGFIPPDAILNNNIPITAASQFYKVRRAKTMIIPAPNGGVTVKKKDYGKDDSPLKIRSYLTVSDSPEMQDVTMFDSHFWVGTIYQSNISLKNCNCIGDAANTFYVSKLTGTGQVLVGTALVSALTVGAYLEAQEE